MVMSVGCLTLVWYQYTYIGAPSVVPLVWLWLSQAYYLQVCMQQCSSAILSWWRLMVTKTEQLATVRSQPEGLLPQEPMLYPSAKS